MDSYYTSTMKSVIKENYLVLCENITKFNNLVREVGEAFLRKG